MSRIPPVRRWIVNYWYDNVVVHTEKVETINKRFAKWLANEQSGYRFLHPGMCDRITVGLSPYQTDAQRRRAFVAKHGVTGGTHETRRG